MGDPKHSLSYLYLYITVHFSWFTLYKYVCPDSSVLCFALRSGQTEWYSIWDSPLEFGASFGDPTIASAFSSSSWFVQRSHLLYWRLHCIWDILLYFISNSDVYIVASWTTILSIPLRIIVLLCVCDSVIDLFTAYAEFCQI